MPRPKKEGAATTKTRSRKGCCGEEKPSCVNCQRQGESCDYSIRLNWDARSKKKDDNVARAQPVSCARSPTVPTQSSQANPLRAADRQVRSPGQSVGLYPPDVTKIIQKGSDPTPRPPFSHINHQKELLPPFTTSASSLARGREDFVRTETHAQPQQNDLLLQSMQAAQSMTTVAHPQHYEHITGYPSPSESSLETLGKGTATPLTAASREMAPPYSAPASTKGTDYDAPPERAAKRMRLSPRNELLSPERHPVPQVTLHSPSNAHAFQRCIFQPSTPKLVSLCEGNPMTPAASSTNSDEVRQARRPTPASQIMPEPIFRRVSVSSLLSSSPEVAKARLAPQSSGQTDAEFTGASPPLDFGSPRRRHRLWMAQSESYGLDRGAPDLDVPMNDDNAAINGSSYPQQSGLDDWLENVELGVPEFGFGLQKRQFVFAKGGYYASPVPIKIPRKLEPLPAMLLENPMNLLYFHHFLNHTARILIVHDCSQNPFRTILPQMAIQNHNLLNLLLAYSASHRARLLSHREPATRIAQWVQDVFPSLRHALEAAERSKMEISDAILATAIMLTSLEIISPSAFGVSISWQTHLDVAWRIIRYRGNCLQPVSRKNPVLHFLHLWFAYIDIFGSFSSRTTAEPLFYATPEGLASDNASVGSDEDDYIIECMLGFTSHCVPVLAQIANLARLCANERDDAEAKETNQKWQPSPDMQAECDRLELELERSRIHPVKQCLHYSHDDDDSVEMRNAFANPEDAIAAHESAATNDAFHRAALIHLLRRVRNLARNAPAVQRAIRAIVDVLSKVRPGGSAEACLLFPMFTAGAEAEDDETRLLILRRLRSLEAVGMMQVGRARRLLEKVWRTGQGWESLAQGEFFG